MAATESLATIAEYFRLGLQVGLLHPAQAISWADSEISETDVPPSELIEISWSNGLLSTMDALAAVPGDRDKQAAGRWLLGLLAQFIPDSQEDLQLAIQRAMQIAREANLGDETYYRFDIIDDELSLARTSAYGTVEQCKVNLAAELAEYPTVKVARGA